ncbi:MAG TPA: bifunctional isocitrate dehydrogenase kinase/phosphatase, partial [Gemmatimonadaceae bacterium]|nr:bifunctional isocitrate dehydrogenase kinase/phosphatase [Gemmatimonadaceae bacterium]
PHAPRPSPLMSHHHAAIALRDAFDAYHEAFRRSAHRMSRLFEARDWSAVPGESAARLDLYREHVLRAIVEIERCTGVRDDHALWTRMRDDYAGLVAGRDDQEIAETFFSSVTRVVFDTVGVDEAIEFHRPWHDDLPRDGLDASCRIVHLDGQVTLDDAARELLDDLPHRLADPAADARALGAALRARVTEAWGSVAPTAVEILPNVFYRARGAYRLGRILGPDRAMPWLVALRGTERGTVVDALLTDADEISIVFGFAWSYFHVDVARPAAMVGYLRGLMPLKRLDELYTGIGYHKHGKTELYRELLHHLAQPGAGFEVAEGTPGLVMSVITLPSFNIVLKIIKDRIGAPKRTTRLEVVSQYRRVFQRDRVGRLADAQLFQGLAFPRRCFSESLLQELTAVAPSVVRVEGDRVALAHLYTQRRVRPLNLHLQEVSAAEADAAILDYGRAIRELAAANIFTGDLLLKNFGVSRHGRVIFYDYDELAAVTDCNFRRVPAPATDEDELSAEPWYHVDDDDVFPEELGTFMVPAGRLRDVFLSEHAELLDADWWIALQERLRAGEQPEVAPYGEARRLGAGNGEPGLGTRD